MFVPDSRPFPQDSSAARRGALGRRHPRRRCRFAPDLLALETRALLSTLTVTNDNDNDNDNDSDSGTGSLRAQLAAAHAGDTIKFAPGAYGTIKLTSGPLQVATAVDIDGPGAKKVTVSGDEKSNVFDVQGGVTATISGLTITDGLFNLASGYGGGAIANYGTLTLARCVVTGNAVASGAGSYGDAGGGAIFTEGPVTVSGSTISGNSADYGGGISDVGGDVTLTDSTVSGNTGDGIDIREGYSDGASVIPNLTLTGCTISGNTGTEFGGGIESGGGNVSVSNSLIADNTVASYPGGGLALGGGILIAGALFTPTPGADILTITGSTFVGNQAITSDGTASGGAIYAQSFVTLSVSDSSFADNTATSPGGIASGGALYSQGLSLGTITACAFTGNQAVVTPAPGVTGGESSGGAIEYDSSFPAQGSLSISDSLFSSNLSQGGQYGAGGGAINSLGYGGGTAMSLTSCLLVDNGAVGGAGTSDSPYGGSGVGGAVATFDTPTTMSDCAFIGNSAIGGADAYAGGSAGIGAGGAILDSGTPMTLTGCTIDGDTARGGAGTDGITGGAAHGGGLNVFGSTCRMTGGTILGNRAIGGAGGGEADGGGVFVSSSGSGANASFTDVLIALNAATGGSGGGSGYGGGLYIGAGALTTLTSTKVKLNFASTAGDDIYGLYTTG